jgi:predicted neuraminidase
MWGKLFMIYDGILRDRASAQNQQEAFIPTPCPQNHAANLLELRDGTLACVWFGGTQEGMADISIHFSRLINNNWSAAIKLQDDPARSEQNPILFNAKNNELWLLYTSQVSGNQDTSIVRRRISHDNGQTWSEPHTLINEIGTFVRQPLVQLDETLLLGTFLCRTEEGVKWVGNDDVSQVKFSHDNGKTWQTVDVPESLGCVHPNIVATNNGLLMLFRSRYADFIYASRSNDHGLTWSVPVASELPNNNSSIQATTLKDGRIALVYNHSSKKNALEQRLGLYDEIEEEGFVEKKPTKTFIKTAFWGAPRAPLMLAISNDDGQTWREKHLLEDGDGYCMTNNSLDKKNRELSYPSIHQTSDGALHIAFTFHRQVIKHIRIKL